MFKQIAAKILQREILPEDGFPESSLQEAEERLGFKLPFALREFYLSLGNIEIFMAAHNRFAPPDELYEDDGMLFFLEENQSVCIWATPVCDVDYDNPSVHMLVETDEVTEEESDDEWYEEETPLPDFIRMMLYYQVAMNGEADSPYEFVGTLNGKMPDELALFVADWEKPVDYNGFTVHYKAGKMLWHMPAADPENGFDIFYQTLNEKDYEEIAEKFGFMEI